MNPPDIPPSQVTYRDRKTGLTVFGVFTILFGLCCGAFVPLTILGQAMSAQSGAPYSQMSVLPTVSIYGLLALALIGLGIGSIMARRWARALLLLFSWSWLVIGVFSLGMMAWMLPQISETIAADGKVDQASVRIIMIFPMIFMGIFFVILPAVWVFFYRSPHVKATCEALDPVERWTDRCPLPMLAICLWLALTAPMMILTGVAYNGVVPVFGTLVSGSTGTAVYILMAAVCAYCAWSLCRLESRGWWVLTTSVVIFCISAFITYSRHDIEELYRLMGYGDAMIAEIQKFNVFRGKSMAWASVAGLPLFLGYMLFVRRYLRRPQLVESELPGP